MNQDRVCVRSHGKVTTINLVYNGTVSNLVQQHCNLRFKIRSDTPLNKEIKPINHEKYILVDKHMRCAQNYLKHLKIEIKKIFPLQLMLNSSDTSKCHRGAPQVPPLHDTSQSKLRVTWCCKSLQVKCTGWHCNSNKEWFMIKHTAGANSKFSFFYIGCLKAK